MLSLEQKHSFWLFVAKRGLSHIIYSDIETMKGNFTMLKTELKKYMENH